jgi:phage tail-like protein
MAKFSVNTGFKDPYLNFLFKIKIDGQYVAGLSKCGALKRTTEVVDWRESGDPLPYKMPGKTSYEAITLEGGVTHDTTFEEWANKVNNFAGPAAMSLLGFRKEFIFIDVFNLQGAMVKSFKVFRCWVSEFQALPELDASGNAVMIQSIKIENEGWERDTSVTEPAAT